MTPILKQITECGELAIMAIRDGNERWAVHYARVAWSLAERHLNM